MAVRCIEKPRQGNHGVVTGGARFKKTVAFDAGRQIDVGQVKVICGARVIPDPNLLNAFADPRGLYGAARRCRACAARVPDEDAGYFKTRH